MLVLRSEFDNVLIAKVIRSCATNANLGLVYYWLDLFLNGANPLSVIEQASHTWRGLPYPLSLHVLLPMLEFQNGAIPEVHIIPENGDEELQQAFEGFRGFSVFVSVDNVCMCVFCEMFIKSLSEVQGNCYTIIVSSTIIGPSAAQLVALLIAA
ncbi:hypothetical protein VNO77_15943 [Canavalia gladiata]|uniref:Uncharacterized protein n=1 Tax=Canavalia gladiata TaxID=3824 RepID=A0AAN9M0U9_CANGL